MMLLMGCGVREENASNRCPVWNWPTGGGGGPEPAGTEPRLPPTTPPATPPITPPRKPVTALGTGTSLADTVIDWAGFGPVGTVLGSSKEICTTRVAPAESLVKCHCKTDCNAALRSSSGPLSTRASTTLPLASVLTSTRSEERRVGKEC